MHGKTINLDIVVYKEDGLHVAHCLQLDLVSTGADLRAVEAEIVELIKAHTEYTIEHNDWEHFFHPAPQEYWALIGNAPPAKETTVNMSTESADAVYNMMHWLSERVFAGSDNTHCSI